MVLLIIVTIIVIIAILCGARSSDKHNKIDNGSSRNTNTHDYNTRNSNIRNVGNNSNHHRSQSFHDPIKSGFDYENDYEKLYEQDTDVLLDTIMKTGGTQALDIFLDDTK